MCLYPKTSKLYVAEKNMTVYKVLCFRKEGLESPWQNAVYKCNKLYSVKTRLGGDKSKKAVDFGLHAFVSANTALERYSSWETTRVFVATIPKGSVYKLGKSGDIVSNQLIVKRLHTFK